MLVTCRTPCGGALPSVAAASPSGELHGWWATCAWASATPSRQTRYGGNRSH